MALDGVFLSRVKCELERLKGGRVDKIHQPSREEIVIALRTRDGLARVIFSTSAGSARVHITTADIENPQTPPMFCMLLRKHLSSGKLVDIRQDGLERILYFDFDSTNEMGDMCRLTIAMEIMGRHSNLILLNSEGRIIDSIKRVGEDMSSVRLVLPGMKYDLPPREKKLSLLEFADVREQFLNELNSFPSLEVSKAIMKIMEGISPIFAREVVFFTTKGVEKTVAELTADELDRLCFYLKKTSDDLQNNSNKYVVLKDKSGVLKDFCFCEINQYSTLMFTRQFETACALLDYFYSERDISLRIKQRSSDLFKLILNLSERISRRTSAQRDELAECAKRDELKVCGDLIMANLYKIQKGDRTASVENFYQEGSPIVEIPLDARLTPSQNAQRFYNEYRKADTAEKKLRELITQGEQEQIYIDSVFDALTRAQSEAEVIALRIELAEQGYVRMAKGKAKPPKEPAPMRFVSSDGFEIFAGRNNKQNDKLTLKDSSKLDIWLHTHNIPGSHVIIKCGGEEVPDTTIIEAAKIAAFNSKAKSSAQVPVDYTQVRNVKKPTGAKPGMVIFVNNKTVFVAPDPDEIEKLKAKRLV